MPLSKEMKKKQDAIEVIEKIPTVEEVNAFIDGEERNEVIAAAQIRIQDLEAKNPKQGEQTGAMTQTTSDFKSGIEGTKAATPTPIVTGDDIVAVIDKADEKRANAAERRDAEAKAREQKAKADAAGPRSYVTGEDVIKALREKGHKI